MLPVTDEPQVTEYTRFWLFSEVRDTAYTWGVGTLDIRHGETFRIKVEVDEATYRKAHAEQCPEDVGDFTMPLDDHWWNDQPIMSPNYMSYQVRVTKGGFIDWDARPYPQATIESDTSQ